MSREDAVTELLSAARANTVVRPELVSLVVDLPVKNIKIMSSRGSFLPAIKISPKKLRYSARAVASLIGLDWSGAL